MDYEPVLGIYGVSGLESVRGGRECVNLEEKGLVCSGSSRRDNREGSLTRPRNKHEEFLFLSQRHSQMLEFEE